jgi:hypothetical protein
MNRLFKIGNDFSSHSVKLDLLPTIKLRYGFYEVDIRSYSKDKHGALQIDNSSLTCYGEMTIEFGSDVYRVDYTIRRYSSSHLSFFKQFSFKLDELILLNLAAKFFCKENKPLI